MGSRSERQTAATGKIFKRITAFWGCDRVCVDYAGEEKADKGVMGSMFLHHASRHHGGVSHCRARITA